MGLKRFIPALRIAMLLGIVSLSITSFAQQPQTSTAPLQAYNTKYNNGVGNGYWPTPGSGLTLNVAAGSVNCAGVPTTYAGGTLTMTASTTNYVYLNTSSSCVPAVKTTAFTTADIIIAEVVTSGSAITTPISDFRTMFVSPVINTLPGTTTGDLFDCANTATPCTTERIGIGTGGQYAAVNSSHLTWITPGITENDIVCSGYTIQQSDLGKPIYCSDTGSADVTLNAPSSYTTGFYFFIKADGTGAITITASGNIEGNSILVIASGNHWAITNNGTTWHAI